MRRQRRSPWWLLGQQRLALALAQVQPLVQEQELLWVPVPVPAPAPVQELVPLRESLEQLRRRNPPLR
jgi:hypothetical protein